MVIPIDAPAGLVHMDRCLLSQNRDQTLIGQTEESRYFGHDVAQLPFADAQSEVGSQLVANLAIAQAQNDLLVHNKQYLEESLERYFQFYNQERPHQSLNYAMPVKVHYGA